MMIVEQVARRAHNRGVVGSNPAASIQLLPLAQLYLP